QQYFDALTFDNKDHTLLSNVKASCFVRASRTPADGLQSRTAAGHARPAHSEDARARASSWMGHLQAHSAALLRGATDRARVALPGPLPARRSRLGRRRVGHLARGAEGQVLPPDRRGPPPARLRDRELASLLAGGEPRVASHLTSRPPGAHALAFPTSPPRAARRRPLGDRARDARGDALSSRDGSRGVGA